MSRPPASAFLKTAAKNRPQDDVKGGDDITGGKEPV